MATLILLLPKLNSFDDMNSKEYSQNGGSFIGVKGGRLFFKQSGLGDKNILWVHGLPLNSDAWSSQLAYFNRLCRNTVFDLRGYGQSSKLPEHYESVTALYMDDFLSIMARVL